MSSRRRPEAQENVALQIAEQIAFPADRAVVNVPSLTAEESKRLQSVHEARPTARRLHRAALTETGITTVAVEYEGAVAELNVKPLTAIALTGLLSPQLATVNMVNASEICRERDIRVSETRRAEPVDYQTLIRVIVTTERRTREIAGTLFRRRQAPHCIGRGHPLEAELGGVLFVRNYDKPGFIGALGNAPGAARSKHRYVPSRPAGAGCHCFGRGRSAADPGHSRPCRALSNE